MNKEINKAWDDEYGMCELAQKKGTESVEDYESKQVIIKLRKEIEEKEREIKEKERLIQQEIREKERLIQEEKRKAQARKVEEKLKQQQLLEEEELHKLKPYIKSLQNQIVAYQNAKNGIVKTLDCIKRLPHQYVNIFNYIEIDIEDGIKKIIKNQI